MYSLKAVALVLGIVGNAVAAPFNWKNFGKSFAPPYCITSAQAADLVAGYVSLTSGETNFKLSVANALLAPGFEDATSSIASVIDGGKIAIELLEQCQQQTPLGAQRTYCEARTFC